MSDPKSGVSAETLQSISTPDKVESRLGTLEFTDGTPSEATTELLYDNLDFVNAVQAYLGSLRGASLVALRRGFASAGVEDNAFTFFPKLMDSASVFLTANSDTVYFWGFINLSDGPMVLDIPPLGPPSGILGTIDDMWFRWVTDFGLPGPDRAQGGRYLLVGPGYEGPLPDSGFHVFHSRTTRVTALGRGFMIDNDPAVPVEAIRNGLRLSPYVPGAQGTAVGTFLAGGAPLASAPEPSSAPLVDLTGASFNTVYPSDFGYWEVVNELVQQEPPGSGDPELLGLLAAVGIVHGQPFKPDDRMRKILEDAVVVGNATARTVAWAPRAEEDVAFYPGSAWFNRLFEGGYEFLDPPPEVTAKGVAPSPSDGARKLNARNWFFYIATGITPAMCMHLTGIGSQYLCATKGSDGKYLEGGRSYRVSLPPNIPHTRFWSMMVYDNQTRSMLQTDQPKPDIGSQSGTVEANADGSTDVYFGPTPPEGKSNNWIQTIPGKGYFAIIRLYNPEPAFFDKSWRPSEIEPI